MALSKDKKNELVDEISDKLKRAKLTVIAEYRGTSVQAMQELRASSQESSTKIKVYKNRLFKKALENDDRFKELDGTAFSGQLLYAFNDVDEVAPAQVLSQFAKNNPQIEFVGAINQEGTFISADEVKQLAGLPGKDVLRSQLAGLLQAPMANFVRVLSGNLRGFANVMEARAKAIS